MVPFTTYYLEPRDFGIAAFINAFLAPMGPLSLNGSIWFLNSKYFNIDEVERKKLIFNIILLIFLLKSFWVIILYFSSSLIFQIFFSDSEQVARNCFIIALLTNWFSILTPLNNQILILEKKAKTYSGLAILRYIFTIATIATCILYFELKVLSLFLGPLIANAILMILEIFILRKNFSFFSLSKDFKNMLKVAINSIPSDLSENLIKLFERLSIQNLLNLSFLGIHSIAHKFNLPFQTVRRAFGQVSISNALEAFSKNDKVVIEKLSILYKKTIWITLAVGVLVIFFSSFVINHMTHGKYSDSAPIMPLIYMSLISYNYGELYIHYLNSIGKMNFLFKTNIVASLISILFVVMGVYFFDLYGAILAIFFANTFLHLWRSSYAKKNGCSVNLNSDLIFSLISFGIIYATEQNFAITLFFKILISFSVLYAIMNKILKI